MTDDDAPVVSGEGGPSLPSLSARARSWLRGDVPLAETALWVSLGYVLGLVVDLRFGTFASLVGLAVVVVVTVLAVIVELERR